jgi:hypothetical protein
MADSINNLVTYIPVILGLLGLNALALIIVSVVGICFFLNRRKRKASKKNRTAGVALSSRSQTPYPGGNGAADHEYERVSAHAPENENDREPEDEPFTPPEPAFHGNDGDVLRPLPGSRVNSFSRPRSMFSTLSGSPSSGTLPIPGRDYRVSTAGSDMTAFVPPSPPFSKTDRPKSIA